MTRDDPSEGWTFNATGCNNVMAESNFADRVIQQRARMLCSNAFAQLKLQCDVRGLPSTRCGFAVPLMQGLMDQLQNGMSEHIRLRNREHTEA